MKAGLGIQPNHSFERTPSAPLNSNVRPRTMSPEEIDALPDSLETDEVSRLTEQVLAASASESPTVTLEKLSLLADRQWHTYVLPPDHVRSHLASWLMANWAPNSQEFLEKVLGISYCYGLEKDLYLRALNAYTGWARAEFESNLLHSPGTAINPWWSLGPPADPH